VFRTAARTAVVTVFAALAVAAPSQAAGGAAGGIVSEGQGYGITVAHAQPGAALMFKDSVRTARELGSR
jgi:hypothetical protein